MNCSASALKNCSASQRPYRCSPVAIGIDGGLRQPDETLEVRHGHGFLDEVGPVLLDLAAPLDGVLQVPALVGVEHDLHVVAHGLAQRLHELHVEIHAARAVAGPVAQEPLLVDEAVLLQAARRASPASGGSIEKPRQLPYTRTGSCVGPPNKRNTGAPKCAAAQIPQRVVDVADGHHEMAGARMAVRAVHLVPDAFDGERVLADDQRPQRA